MYAKGAGGLFSGLSNSKSALTNAVYDLEEGRITADEFADIVQETTNQVNRATTIQAKQNYAKGGYTSEDLQAYMGAVGTTLESDESLLK